MDAVPTSGHDGAAIDSVPTSQLGDLVNPFKALNSFQESDADDFHGRERLVDRFVEILRQPGSAGRLLAVVGPSGSGKSSAVRSGLLTHLRSGAVPGSDDWFITTMVPGSHPFDELESALSRVAVRQPGPLVEMMRGHGRGIARAINQTLPDAESELLVVIDQFEELFTHTDVDERTRFLDGLLAAVREPRARVRLVITIRADFMDGPLRHPQLAARLETSTVTVSPLAPDELEAAIVEPVHGQGARYEPGLVARLMADAGDQPGALPLLQYALTELFDANVAGLLRIDSYEAMGGLAGALATRAEATLTAMPSERQAAARRLFGRLVTLGEGTEDTRRRVLQRDLGNDPDTVAVIETFGAARLVVFDHDPTTREPTVEIAHEALLRAWPRLTGWLDEDRSDLRTLARVAASTDAWVGSGRDDGELARGARLEVATELAGRRGDVLNEAESDWIAASSAAAVAVEEAKVAAADRDRLQNRRLRRLLGVAAALVVIATIAAGVAIVQRNRAVDSEATAVDAMETASAAQAEAEAADQAALDARADEAAAEQAALDAEGEALASAVEEAAAEENALVDRLTRLSARQIDTQPDLAALLALEANRRRDDVGTQSSVQSVLAGLRGGATILPADFAADSPIHFSDDGRVGVTWSSESGEIIWFDAQTGQRQGTPFVAGPLRGIQVSGDGSVIAYSPRGSNRTIVARRTADGMAELNEVDGYPFALDRSGTTLLVDPTAQPPLDDMQIVDVVTGEARSTFAVPDDAQRALLDDEGLYAVLWTQSTPSAASIHVFDTGTGELRERLDHGGFVNGATVAADDRIITGFFDGTLLVSRLSPQAGPATERRFPAHVGAIDIIRPLQSGMIVTYGRDRSIRFWSGETPTQQIPPLLDQAGLTQVAADETGLTLRQANGGMVRLDPFSRSALPIVEAEVRQPGRFGFEPGSPWWNSNPEGDQTILRLTRLDGDERRDIDVRSVHPTGWHGFNFSPDGNWLRTSDADRTSGRIGIWEIAGDRRAVVELAPIWEQLGIESPWTYLLLGHGGQRLFVVDRTPQSLVAMWIDVGNGQIVAGPTPVDEFSEALVLDGGHVVLGGIGPAAVLPPGLDGEPTLVAETEGLTPFHQDRTSGLVLLMGDLGEVALFDPVTGDVDQLEPVPGPAQGGAFSPSGDRIAITSVAGGVQLYDVATRQKIGDPIISDGFGVGADTNLGGYGIAWSADGRGVWAVSLEGPVRYAADPDRWRAIACDIADREFTLDEWRRYVSDTELHVAVCG